MLNLYNAGLRATGSLCFLLSGGVFVAASVFCLVEINAVKGDKEEIAFARLPPVQQAPEISQLRLRYLRFAA